MWVHSYTVMPVWVGVDFRKIGAWLCPSDVVRSWLRLQTTRDCIPQPWNIYATCFSTLRCCGWAYGGCPLKTRIFLRTKLANNYKTARKQNFERWCLLTTAAASHHYLTHPPLAETTIRWSWLVVVCLGAGWVAPRRHWDDGSRHGWKVCLALILLVFCMCRFTWTSSSWQKIG